MISEARSDAQTLFRRIALNQAAALREREYLAGTAIVSALPSMLSIEVTNICNLRCVMCAHGRGLIKDPKQIPEGFLRKIRPALDLASHVELFGIGEPLGSTVFWSTLEALSETALPVTISSNALLLRPDKDDKILNSTLSRITFSLDAATPETYRLIRGADFAQAVGNIRRFVSKRAATGRTKPEIFINMTLMRKNIEEVAQFVDLAASLGVDGVSLQHLNDVETDRDAQVERDGWQFVYGEQLLNNHVALSNREIQRAIDRAADRRIELTWDLKRPVLFPESAPAELASPASAPVGDTVKCRAPWEWMTLGVEGYVRPCCFATLPTGNLKESTPEEVWNNLTMQSLRSTLKKGLIHTICNGAACGFVGGKTNGRSDLASPAPSEFDEKWYIESYPDVARGLEEGLWPDGLTHYRSLGKQEGRVYNANEAASRPRPARPELADYASEVRVLQSSREPGDGLRFVCVVELRNVGAKSWLPGSLPEQLRPGCRIYADLEADGPALLEFRANLEAPLHSGESASFTFHLDLSSLKPGRYFAVFDAVNELKFWFSDKVGYPAALALEGLPSLREESPHHQIETCARPPSAP